MPEPIQIDEQGNIIFKLNWKRMLKVVIIILEIKKPQNHTFILHMTCGQI